LVSAIIPARNEEDTIKRAVESLEQQPEVTEIIVVNDQSTDRTGAILAGLANRVPKLRVLNTGELPAGWMGKNYAVSVGARAATGEWLLFTDADTYHYPGSTRRALGDAVDHRAAMVSYSPEQEMDSFWERALIPYVYCRLAARYSFKKVSDSSLPDAAANGQFLLILREVYNAVGGHAAVAKEMVEDVALARLVKSRGYTIYFASPVGVVRTRMYRTFGAMWQGWTKNLYLLMGGRTRNLIEELILATSPYVLLVLPWIYIQIGKNWWESIGATLVLWFVVVHVYYARELDKNLLPLRLIQYYAPGHCLYIAMVIASWWKNTRGTVVWKGRAYPAKTS
jgi:glycosyltransferase involved in cell wall biosynthesis